MESKIFRNKDRKTALVFGGSGLVGSELVRQLCDFSDYKEVICIHRKPQNFKYSNCKEIISDFSNPEGLLQGIQADEVFCCLGTTIKKAGSKENFTKVDYDLPLAIGRACVKNGVKHYVIISSVGADPKSGNFYLRTKGTMEQEVLKLSLPQVTIVRPSMLLGNRKEFRFGEQAGKMLMNIIQPLMFGSLKRYRPIQASVVASAMIIIANSNPTKQKFFESHQLQEIVDAEN